MRLTKHLQEIQAGNPSAHIIYINKEDFAFSHLKTAEELAEFILAEKRTVSKITSLLMK
ncbi:hypothetical protein [Glaesserella sp.]|uniref:hypothetical protein n=1 Tax=Glaesserella sp. TaxID=2094731 RepID=UPI00359FAA44